MSEHIAKLVQATESHRDMRAAMSKRSLELAAELEDQRVRQDAEQAAQNPQPGQADSDSGQGSVS